MVSPQASGEIPSPGLVISVNRSDDSTTHELAQKRRLQWRTPEAHQKASAHVSSIGLPDKVVFVTVTFEAIVRIFAEWELDLKVVADYTIIVVWRRRQEYAFGRKPSRRLSISYRVPGPPRVRPSAKPCLCPTVRGRRARRRWQRRRHLLPSSSTTEKCRSFMAGFSDHRRLVHGGCHTVERLAQAPVSGGLSHTSVVDDEAKLPLCR
ncbi:hypothetical protein MRX96_030406 [Rhipicephalus microplus]